MQSYACCVQVSVLFKTKRVGRRDVTHHACAARKWWEARVCARAAVLSKARTKTQSIRRKQNAETGKGVCTKEAVAPGRRPSTSRPSSVVARAVRKDGVSTRADDARVRVARSA